MSFHRRKLPHWQPYGAEYFITFRLTGSLPRNLVNALKKEQDKLMEVHKDKQVHSDKLSDRRVKVHKYIFKKYDQFLDNSETGPTWLSKKVIAEIVKEAIHYRDKSEYDLYAYCIMSNHVHLVIKLNDPKNINADENTPFPVSNILKSLKWYTALEANKVLERTGNSFWQAESYDHVIRDPEELNRVIYYTLQNPVKAGLTDSWQKWPHSYCKPKFIDLYRSK